MKEAIPLLIDTDPGVDDAMALLMAFNDPRFEVVGLTVAAGNVGLNHTVANALKLCEVANVDVPVFPGCAVPLVHAAADAAYVHGKDGLGDIAYTPSSRRPEDEHAALAIIRLSKQYAGRLLLVTLGPLTNLALALRLDPTLPDRVERLVVMGGAVTGRGNTGILAEFNVAFDPEAAKVVFEAFSAFDLIDWEAVVRHGLLHRDIETWLASGDARARFYEAISAKTRAWSESLRGKSWYCADALAMAMALDPDAATAVQVRPLVVELEGRMSRGATVVDWLLRSGSPANARILMQYDQARFESMVRRALGG